MARRGLRTQEQLAQEIGVGRATVVRAFSGRTPPGDAVIAGLRLRLGLSLDQIVEVVPDARDDAR